MMTTSATPAAERFRRAVASYALVGHVLVGLLVGLTVGVAAAAPLGLSVIQGTGVVLGTGVLLSSVVAIPGLVRVDR